MSSSWIQIICLLFITIINILIKTSLVVRTPTRIRLPILPATFRLHLKLSWVTRSQPPDFRTAQRFQTPLLDPHRVPPYLWITVCKLRLPTAKLCRGGDKCANSSRSVSTKSVWFGWPLLWRPSHCRALLSSASRKLETSMSWQQAAEINDKTSDYYLDVMLFMSVLSVPDPYIYMYV